LGWGKVGFFLHPDLDWAIWGGSALFVPPTVSEVEISFVKRSYQETTKKTLRNT
jgi:hypothetical protein